VTTPVLVSALAALVTVASVAVLAPFVARREPAASPATPAAESGASPPPPRSEIGGRNGRGRKIVAGAAAATTVALAAGVLVASLAPRSEGSPATGSLPGAADLPVDLPGLRQVATADPGNVQTLLALGRAQVAASRTSAAVRTFRDVLRVDPTNAEAIARLGLIVSLSGRPAAGLAAIDRSLRLDPSFVESYLFRGIVLSQVLHRPHAARTAMRRYLAGSA
jgi:hypothetical protein